MRWTTTTKSIGATLVIATTHSVADASADHSEYLRKRLSETRAIYKVPALTAGVWSHQTLAARAVVGVRHVNYQSLAQITDKFHIGSITKPMTSTLIARLIELGFLDDYFMKLGNVQPWQFGDKNTSYWFDQYKNASLLSLMAHVDGMHYQPENEPDDEYASLGVQNLVLRREAYVKDAIKDAPYGKIGEKRVYAGGHIVAASMLETIMGQTWEDLIDQYVWTPLGMSSAGFGPMSSVSSVTGPWEHYWGGTKPVYRQWPANYQYEPHAPAGRNIHCSITDLVKFGASHLDVAAGSTRILTGSDIQVLRTVVWPSATDLDGEVVKMTPAWFPSTITHNNTSVSTRWHNGDNGFNYAWLEVAPTAGTGLSYAVMTNIGRGTGSPASPAINRMREHCIDIDEHYNMIDRITSNLSYNKGRTAFGNVTGSMYINDNNFRTGASFPAAGSAISINFPSSTSVGYVHVSDPERKIKRYSIDRWSQGAGGIGGFVSFFEGTTVPRDGTVRIPTTSSTSFRLRILEATSYPVKVEEFWLLPYITIAR